MKLRKATWVRLAVITVAVGALEVACRTGLIKPFTMIAPSQMVVGLVHILSDPEFLVDIRNTMTSVVIALVCALVGGCVIGALLHASPRARRIADPLLSTYYSVPVFVFYPLLIVLFGLNAIPKTVIGFLYAVVAMVINTLNGLDRVPPVFWKTARIYQLGRFDTALRVIFPCAGPYLFTGAKLAIVYSFIGVIGSEFI